MIQPSELRIGNWFKGNGKFIKVESLYDQGINLRIESGYYGECEEHYDAYFKNHWYAGCVAEPIPLTPEVLEMCGCVKDFESSPHYRLPMDEFVNIIFIKVSGDNTKFHIGFEQDMKGAGGFGIEEAADIIKQEKAKGRTIDEKSFAMKYNAVYPTGHVKQYLHEIQNIFYNITGTELEIKNVTV